MRMAPAAGGNLVTTISLIGGLREAAHTVFEPTPIPVHLHDLALPVVPGQIMLAHV